MIDVEQVTTLHRETVDRWHRQPLDNPYQGFFQLVCRQHQFNYLLWHEEDAARSRQVSDARIAEVKRNIDRYNQSRNDWIERLDDDLIRRLAESGVVTPAGAPLNTETPGSVIDRLSILSLRIYHMREQADREDAGGAHRDKALGKVAILHEQLADLSASLAQLADDIAHGRRRLKVYRQFKMYNDPALNPHLYTSPRRRAG